MSCKTFTSHSTGPVWFRPYRATNINVEVSIEDRARADITVTTTDPFGPSARIVENTRFEQVGNAIVMVVPRSFTDDSCLIVEARLPLGSSVADRWSVADR